MKKNINRSGKGRFDPRPSGTALPGAMLNGQSAAAYVNCRLASREWWLFVTCDERGAGFLAHLERTFYAGKANRDFEVLVLPALPEGLGVVGLFLARKNRMPADRLQREIAERVGPISVAELLERDVLFPHPDLTVAQALAKFLVDFLKRGSRPEDN